MKSSSPLRLGGLGAIVVAGLAACQADPSPTASSPTASAPPATPPSASADGAAPAPATGPLTRNQSWPLLQRWLDGQSIPTDPVQGPPPLDHEARAARGQALFSMYCVQCHGAEGRGDGPRSPLFDPAPRDLTSGTFKFRSTPSGTLPTRGDLFRTISGGLRGTGMMPFADLPEADRWALVAYVTTLSPRFAAETAPATPIEVPHPPHDLDDPARATAGQQAFADLGCAQCHGPGGRGDGPGADGLTDAWGQPTRPTDLALRKPKRGDSAQAIYRSLATGLDGTPMPAFGEVAKPDQLWDAVAFVRALGRSGPEATEKRAIAEAEAVLAFQHKQGKHAVVGGCGCQARRRGGS